MTSYASVDRIIREYAVCELELVSTSESNPTDYDKPTEMVEIPMEFIQEAIKEGDILVIEHDAGCIRRVYGKDNEEKKRRIKLLEQLQE